MNLMQAKINDNQIEKHSISHIESYRVDSKTPSPDTLQIKANQTWGKEITDDVDLEIEGIDKFTQRLELIN